MSAQLTQIEQQDTVMVAFCHGAYARFESIAAVPESERGVVAKIGADAITAAFARVDYFLLRSFAQTLVRMESDPALAMRDSLKTHVTMLKQMIRDVVGIERNPDPA